MNSTEGGSPTSRKITFLLDADAWHGYATETLWATQTGVDRFRLENSPFFANGVSYEDEVKVRISGGELIFEAVAKRGGHSTYRVLMDRTVANGNVQRYWEPLQNLGCTYESREGKTRLWAIDVPPEADIHSVYRLLEKGESDGVWSFEEAHCGHPIS
jgi:hypothetical protein